MRNPSGWVQIDYRNDKTIIVISFQMKWLYELNKLVLGFHWIEQSSLFSNINV